MEPVWMGGIAACVMWWAGVDVLSFTDVFRGTGDAGGMGVSRRNETNRALSTASLLSIADVMSVRGAAGRSNAISRMR